MAEDPTAHLLVIVGEGSRRIPLRPGSCTFGRSEEADVRIDDSSVSRRHARLQLDDRGAEVTDLGSRNGVCVNGARIDERCRLTSGDVLTLGEASVILYLDRRVAWAPVVVDAAHTLDRLAVEVDRAARFDRPLALLVIELPSVKAASLAKLLLPVLRPCDVAGFLPDGGLLVVFPELDAEAGDAAAGATLRALAPAGPIRSGTARCPADGIDAGALVAAARRHADPARPSGAVTFALGDRSAVVADPGMLRIHDLLRQLATSDRPVVLVGETGVGKETAARALHAWSPHASAPFVSVRCSGTPEAVERELFGHRLGERPGLFESAAGGTLFLDEVSALSLAAQARLVRALDTSHIARVDDSAQIVVDVRLVVATDRSLDDAVEAGGFDAELRARLGVAPVTLPPLRDRARDIPVLARTFLDAACANLGREPLRLSDATLWRLAACRFPGNVRELAQAMDYAAVVAADPAVEPWHLPPTLAVGGGGGAPPGSADERR